MAQLKPFSVWPRRIFLDTCTVQAMADCGNFVFGEDAFEEIAPAQITRRKDGAEILYHLRALFLFDDRASFDWIVSSSSILETDRRKDWHQSRYIRDIIDHSEICVTENPPDQNAREYAAGIDDRYFNFLSKKDRVLIKEAVSAGCDTFLTVESRLLKNHDAVLNRVPLMIANPVTLWETLGCVDKRCYPNHSGGE